LGTNAFRITNAFKGIIRSRKVRKIQ